MTTKTSFYVKSADTKEEVMALAFTLDSSSRQQEEKECLGLYWSPSVKSLLKNVRERASDHSQKPYLQLPYTALRFDIEATTANLLTVYKHLGLKKGCLATNDPQPFLTAESEQEKKIIKQVNNSFHSWSFGELERFCQRHQTDTQFLDRLDQLYTQNEVLHSRQEVMRPFDWKSGYQSPAKGNFTGIFEDLSSVLLKTLSGLVIHPSLGKLLPIISRYQTNAIELMTPPLQLEETEAEFSLRLKLSVETLPQYNKPLITVTFTRSRWLDSQTFPNEKWYRQDITGYVHDFGGTGRCIAFELFKNEELGKYEFKDDVYSRMQQRCQLPANGTVEDLKHRRLHSQQAEARAIFTNQMPSGHPLNHGFMTADRVILFDVIAEAFSKIGVVPWQDWIEVKSKKMAKKSIRTLLNLQTVLEDLKSDDELVEEDNITPELLIAILKRAFSLQPEELKDQLGGVDSEKDKSKEVKKAINRKAKLEEVKAINRNAIQQVFKLTPPSLVVIGENPKRRQIITELAKILFGDAVNIHQAILPKNAYGTKLKGVKKAEHVQQQVALWSETVSKLKGVCSPPRFALVEAPLWFKSEEGKGIQKDYPPNKVAAKMALANGEIATQYLNPPERTKEGKIYLGEYLYRVQNALYDLLFAHSGYAEAVPESIEQLFVGQMANRKPRYVVGLAVLAKNKTWFDDRRKLIVAIRYDAQIGESQLKYSYWEKGKSKISAWLPFTEGLFSISRLSEHTLGPKAEEMGNNIVDFCYQVIEEVAKEDPFAIILVHSTHINNKSAWSWLQDKKLQPENISIGNKPFKKSWAGLRIIRCRTTTSPSLCQRKKVIYQEIDDQGREIPGNTFTAPVHTNVPTLIRVRGTSIPTFLSVAPPTRNLQYKRGQSVFEKRRLPYEVAKKGKGKEYLNVAPQIPGKRVYVVTEGDLETMPAAFPRSVELAIVHQPPEDEAEVLIRLVESLRFGHAQYQEWTTLPFVLHAMFTVEKYVNTFELEEDMEGEEENI